MATLSELSEDAKDSVNRRLYELVCESIESNKEDYICSALCGTTGRLMFDEAELMRYFEEHSPDLAKVVVVRHGVLGKIYYTLVKGRQEVIVCWRVKNEGGLWRET